MIGIGWAAGGIKAHLQQRVPAELILQICRRIGYQWRERILGPVQTFHLLMLQLLAHASLAALRRVAHLTVTAQSLCAAQMRLPLRLFLELIEALYGQNQPTETWHGHRVRLVDGMSFLTHDTPELAQSYGKAKNQRGTSPGFPLPKLLASLDLQGGLIRKVIALPHARQEQTCLSRLFAYLLPGDLLLGDCAMVSFAHLALMRQEGLQCCMFLSKALVTPAQGRPHARRVRHLGKQDWLVRWIKPERRVKWMSKRRWSQLPEQLILRQIAFRVRRRGFRTRWVWLISTLIDPQIYPPQELVELAARRWQVEVDFRDLRLTLELKQIRPKTVAGVRKEIVAFVLLYNLIHEVMNQAAKVQLVEPDRISFKDAAMWLLWSQPGEFLPKLVVNPRRDRDTQERKVKRGRKRFSQLKHSREEARTPRPQAVL